MPALWVLSCTLTHLLHVAGAKLDGHQAHHGICIAGVQRQHALIGGLCTLHIAQLVAASGDAKAHLCWRIGALTQRLAIPV